MNRINIACKIDKHVDAIHFLWMERTLVRDDNLIEVRLVIASSADNNTVTDALSKLNIGLGRVELVGNTHHYFKDVSIIKINVFTENYLKAVEDLPKIYIYNYKEHMDNYIYERIKLCELDHLSASVMHGDVVETMFVDNILLDSSDIRYSIATLPELMLLDCYVFILLKELNVKHA